MTQPQTGRVYILNSPVLTGYGRWQFDGPLEVAQVRPIVADGFISAVGHAGTAQFLSVLLGVEIPANRTVIAMQPGDRALVLRLHARLPEGAVLTRDEMAKLPFELGLLQRLS
jgi:hypothetical protein